VYLAAFAVYLLVRFLALGTIMRMAPYSHNNPLLAVEWPIRMLTAIAVLGRYCWLLMVPLRLSADYSHAQIPLTRSPLEVGVLLPALGLLAVAVVAGAVWRRQPVFAFGLLFSLVAIAPAANIFFPIGTIMGERLLYLPSLGFCLWLAACATGLYVLLPRQGAGRAALLVACASILVFYIGRSIVRNRDWQAPLTLWQATVQTSPRSAKAHYNLGDALFTQGDLNGAEREMRAVLQIDPGSGKAYNELGLTLMQQGRSGEALATFEAALRIWPEFAPLHLNLGRFYEQRGMASLALREYQLAAAYAPSIPALGFQLALASDLFVRGDLVTVERLLRRVVRDHPFSAEAQFNLGTVYRKQGMLPEAVTAFQEAVRLKPQYPKAHYALGVVLDLQGRSQEAQRAFEDAKRQWKPAPSGERQ
jgi:tetratricopeptide (TPR) repeat protein